MITTNKTYDTNIYERPEGRFLLSGQRASHRGCTKIKKRSLQLTGSWQNIIAAQFGTIIDSGFERKRGGGGILHSFKSISIIAAANDSSKDKLKMNHTSFFFMEINQ